MVSKEHDPDRSYQRGVVIAAATVLVIYFQCIFQAEIA